MPDLNQCMTEGAHCYCLDAVPDERRVEPHVECCNCGHVKLAPYRLPPQLSFYPPVIKAGPPE